MCGLEHERQPRRIVLLEADERVLAVGLDALSARPLLRSIISGLRCGEDLGQIGKGKQRESLIVEIEGGIDAGCRRHPQARRKSPFGCR